MSTFNAALYNNLHSIEGANRLFTNRDEILSKLAQLFSKEENQQFGLCLVHRHCVLEEGERMVAKGNISQPERHMKDSECYPERWLATGEAYEFNREPTISPSQELFRDFRQIIGDSEILGVFFIRSEEKGGVALERTEGRRNIVEIVPYRTPRLAITTAWLPGRSQNDYFTSKVMLYECASCSIVGNGHVENVGKMEGLERRRDLGHEIEFEDDIAVLCA